MLFKKTLVLSSCDGGNEKAVLNVEKDKGEYLGQIKLYNFHSEPDGILSLGLKDENAVHKAGLTKIGNMKYSFCFSLPINLEKFSCAIININHGKAKALVNGSTDNVKMSETMLAKAVMEMEDVKSATECEKVLDDNNIRLEDEEKIEEVIDENINKTTEQSCDRCSNCKYRYAFFSNEEEQKEEESTFYDLIKEDVNKLFSAYNEEELLCKIIPFSKWVKIENEESEDYYVLGLIYENDEVKYICYGVPGMYSETPPQELNGLAQWLPLDITKETEYGYWITYQDAKSGENVNAEFSVV